MKKLFPLTLIAASLIVAGCNSNNNDNDKKVETIPATQLTPATPSCATSTDVCRFTVVHTNDNHGRFWKSPEKDGAEYGMAARKSLINLIKTDVETYGGEILILSGGDINTGVPESDLQDAKPDFIGMNMIGYDAMAVGNHEFDNPLSVLEMQRSLAEFPMLAANIYHEVDGERVRYFEPYKIFVKDGLRIAVVGLTTEDTIRISNPDFVEGLEFTDPKKEMKLVAKELRDSGKVDVVLATTHMGHYQDGTNGSNAPGDVALARSLEAGMLDAVIGGHSQNPVCMELGTNNYADFQIGDDCTPDKQNGTYIMQAHEWGKYVGRADFEYSDGALTLSSYKLIPVNLKKPDLVKGYGLEKDENDNFIFVDGEIVEDPAVLAELKPYQDEGERLTMEVIGTLSGSLEGTRAIVRNEQTNLGNFITHAQSNDVRVNADFGIMNSGGIRKSITPEEDTGNVTYHDVLSVHPFGNVVTKITMPGSELVKYLGAVATKNRNSGAYAQFNGIKMDINCTAENLDDAVTIREIAGEAFDASRSYSFTIPSFNAAGGDKYPKLDSTSDTYTNLVKIDTGLVDADLLYQFIKATGAINAADYTVVASDLVYSNSKDGSDKGCGAAPKTTETPAS